VLRPPQAMMSPKERPSFRASEAQVCGNRCYSPQVAEGGDRLTSEWSARYSLGLILRLATSTGTSPEGYGEEGTVTSLMTDRIPADGISRLSHKFND
jgi:hypothetical protein